MDKKISIRQFTSPEHPYIAFPQKNLAVLDISRFTTGEIWPQSRLYADDLTLLAPTLSGLQVLIKICERYADEFDIKFNGTKSV